MVSPRTARPYHHGNLRAALVEAGFALARSGGPEAVVLRAVSRDAGVSHNAAYRHFADHDQLLAAVGQRCMRELADLMRRRMAQVRTPDRVRRAWDRLDAIGHAYVEFATTEPGWFRTAFAIHEPPDEAPPPPSPDEGDLGPYELLGACLDELVHVGALPAERRPGAEYAAWSTVHGLSMLLLEGPLRTVLTADPGEAER
ncbi:MAG TPA: TetR/AcrR family transcriptional regulator, partial [Jatrophihabitans sp.]|nr:TetR/AcrR family transcriptional regulator [Jatrophihabitans sp.]